MTIKSEPWFNELVEQYLKKNFTICDKCKCLVDSTSIQDHLATHK